jgi:hypothetical protein
MAAFRSVSGPCEWLQGTTAFGRRLPFAGIAKGFDRVTATKGWSRPKSTIHVHCRERPLWDRKADIAYEEIIVRRSNRLLVRILRRKRTWDGPPHLVAL